MIQFEPSNPVESMNLDKLHSNLIAAARKAPPPSDAVPYAFEKRIVARLASLPCNEGESLWNRMLWRAAVPSILIMLSASLWFLMAQDVGPAANLGTELEDAVFAPAYAAIEETW
jgi:hypothetical protein